MTWKTRTKDMFESTEKRSAAHLCSLWNSKNAGTEALRAINTPGYKQGSVFGKVVIAHRVAWAIYYGHWPSGQIDHINGDRTDNRICNLRIVSCHENMLNKGIQSNNSSGAVGVSKYKNSKWFAHIRVNGRRIHLGYYDDFESALKARIDAEERFGFFANDRRLKND